MAICKKPQTLCMYERNLAHMLLAPDKVSNALVTVLYHSIRYSTIYRLGDSEFLKTCVYVFSAGTEPGPTQNLPLILGVAVGLVVLLVVTVLMIIIVQSVVLVRHRKPTTAKEEPFYDYVTPSQLPAQNERIQLKENEAYEKKLSVTSQPQVSTSLQPNIAYGVVQTNLAKI